MDFIGAIGFSLASAAYALFALLIIAARNNSLLARWVLFCTLITFSSNLIAALQIKLGYSLQWTMFADGFKLILKPFCTIPDTSRPLFGHFPNFHIFYPLFGLKWVILRIFS